MKQRSIEALAALGLAVVSVFLGGCSRDAQELPTALKAVRILPTNAASVDLVFDLVGSERVAAVPMTVDEFSNVAIDSKRFGPARRFREFSAEVLLGFTPDLAVVSPWQGQDTIMRMREAGVRVVEMLPVENLESLRVGILELGSVLGVEARAAGLVSEFDQRVVALERAGIARAGATAVSYTNYGSGGWVAGSGTTADMVMRLAGLTNRAAESGRKGHDLIDIETLLTWDPEWIVVSKPSTTLGVTRAYLEGEEALASLRAIKAGRIVEVPAALYSTTSHYLVRAAEVLAGELERIDPVGRPGGLAIEESE